MAEAVGTPGRFWRYCGDRLSDRTQAEAKMRLIILIILIILIVGALPSWGYSTGWGYYPVGGLGTLLIIILILALLGYV
jgi:hypothetical protein